MLGSNAVPSEMSWFLGLKNSFFSIESMRSCSSSTTGSTDSTVSTCAAASSHPASASSCCGGSEVAGAALRGVKAPSTELVRSARGVACSGGLSGWLDALSVKGDVGVCGTNEMFFSLWSNLCSSSCCGR